ADSNLIAEARYYDQTSLLMRGIGQATGLSPKMLDHIVQGYTGTLGAYVLGAGNIVARQFTDAGETPTLRLDELPVIKSFLRGADPAKSTQFADDFYRMVSQANQISRTINAYREQGRSADARALQEDNRGLLSKRQALTRTQKAIRQLNDRIEMVRIDRTLNAQEKRERIDRMMGQRNKLYQQAVERVHPYFD
ncbi:LPD38 domain-containing protein, partial [Candidatus Symbiopectobacterium sp. NZEC135]|uniref:LPD38 domain-containing protein n=1 Tax=Candidatus Symbiopectobacterium sp. NZEC135 TaxID=2820471 RepID=UPI0029CAB81A